MLCNIIHTITYTACINTKLISKQLPASLFLFLFALRLARTPAPSRKHACADLQN